MFSKGGYIGVVWDTEILDITASAQLEQDDVRSDQLRTSVAHRTSPLLTLAVTKRANADMILA